MKTFPDVLEELYESRFTGKLTIHVLNGVPRAIEFPGPKVDLQREPVDKGKKVVEAVHV